MKPTFQSSSREQRLDFWRGLCLIDMVLVHLYYESKVQFGDFFGRLLGDYTRFAAGGFIFVSGLSIGVIFWPRAKDDRKRKSTYKKLLRRSVYILFINYISGMVLISIDLLQNGMGSFTHILSRLRDLFFLREGGDLLPFYVLMIAVSPIVMQALRFKWGWLGVMISSISLFVWGLWHPWAFSPAQPQLFPPVLWQAIFMLGLLLGFAWPKYNALSFAWKAWLASVCWLITGILFVMEYGYQWDMKWLSFGTAFTKVPLSTPETLRYLSIIFAIITTTDLVWAKLGALAPSAFVQTLGKKSLPVYVVHLWIIQFATFLAARWTFMGNWQLLFAPVAILTLWLFALILDVTSQPKTPVPAVATRPAIFGPEPMPGAAQ